MRRLGKELKILTKIGNALLFFTVLFLMGVFGGAYVILRPIYIEEYCRKKVEGMLGDRRNVLVEMTDEEKLRFPDGGNIALGYREQLKCEKEKRQGFL